MKTGAKTARSLAALLALALSWLPAPAAAKDDITVQGATILRDGKPWIAKGVAVDTFIGADREMTQKFGEEELKAISAYGADVVRFSVSQNPLDPQSPTYAPKKYLAAIVDAVRLTRAHGFVVIVSGYTPRQNPPPGENKLPSDVTLRAWRQLAPEFKSDMGVMLEILGEPTGATQDLTRQPWEEWRKSHQRVLDAIRQAGAHNAVLVEGLKWGHLLAGAPALNDPDGKIIYAEHPYPNVHFNTPAHWDAEFGRFAAQHPVLITEWNARARTPYCFPGMPEVARQFLDYVKAHRLGIIGWAFDYPDGLRKADGALTTFDNFSCDGGAAAGTLLHDYFRKN